MTYIRFAVEGTTDEPVADRLIREVGMEPMPTFIGGGKTQLDPKLPGYNQAARRSAWLVLRDLDHDDAGGCVPRLIEDLLGSAPSAGMAFRIAVREVEAWLLADAAGCTRFFRVSAANVPRDVEALSSPKRSLVDMCRSSRKREIRDGIVPTHGSRRDVGDSYVALLREFVHDTWDPQRARQAAPSLDRAILALERLRN